MSSNVIGYVGKPYLEFIEWLHNLGYQIHLFHDINEPIRDDSKVSSLIVEKYLLDFSNHQTFLKQVSTLTVSPSLFVSFFENAVLPKSWLTTYFSLPGLSTQSAEKATDKSLMRQAFSSNCPQYSAYYSSVSCWEDVEKALSSSTFQFPLILKPTNLFKSLLVTKSSNLQELKFNFDQSVLQIQEIYRKEHVTRTPNFVLEEYLDGLSYSLEVFADANGNMVSAPSPVDLVMGKDLALNDNYNYSRKLPTSLTLEEQQRIQQAAFAGVKALKILNSPAHVELVYTKSGPKIIEIGARTGGYRARMHQLSEGVNLFQAQLDVAQGKLPSLTKKFSHYCAVYELFPLKQGSFQSIAFLDEIQQLSSLYYSHISAHPGDLVGPSKDGFRFTAVFIFASDDQVRFKAETALFEEKAKVLTTH